MKNLSPTPAAALRASLPDIQISMDKGSSLKGALDVEAIDCLARNVALAHPVFEAKRFRRAALKGIEPLGIMERGRHIAHALRPYLPENYIEAIGVLTRSLTPPNIETSGYGLAVFFYLPHSYFVSEYGVAAIEAGDDEAFDASLEFKYALTRRFTAEFAIRPFLIRWPERTLARLLDWTRDPDPHVRRLCSEGARPRLPWAPRIPAFAKDPTPVLPILERLKDDPELYVRRSVANHLGDIAKDHPELVFEICGRWLEGATFERKWLIRHALRHPSKKGVEAALRLRSLAK